MPDYNSHGIEKFRVKIGDMPGAKIDAYFDKVSDLIGKLLYITCLMAFYACFFVINLGIFLLNFIQ